jgi:pimeloyl-ACP methyl ester carboxylesterase
VALPALVLVHGGAHAGDCWDFTVDEIHRIAPEMTVLAVDLPGRRGKPGDLRTLTIADSVNSVVADIEEVGLGEVVVVGHSMAGLTVPGVVTQLGASRVRACDCLRGRVCPARRHCHGGYAYRPDRAHRATPRQEGRTRRDAAGDGEIGVYEWSATCAT